MTTSAVSLGWPRRSFFSTSILFLDFDGVLNRYTTALDQFEPECVQHLNRVWRQQRPHIVVSSAWRTYYPLEQLQSFLATVGFIGELSDMTLDLHRHDRTSVPPYYKQRLAPRRMGEPRRVSDPNGQQQCDRGDEILEWLRRHSRGTDRVVVLDDNPVGAMAHRLVRTDPNHGLTEADAQRAIDMLST